MEVIFQSLYLIFLGVGMSSIFGALLGYLSEQFPVTGKVTSAFLVAACVGEFVWPLIVGNYIAESPQVYLTCIAICTTMCCILFVVIVIINRKFVKVTQSNVDLRMSVVQPNTN